MNETSRRRSACLLVPSLLVAAMAMGCTSGSEDARPAGSTAPVARQVAGQPRTEADTKPAAAVSPAAPPAAEPEAQAPAKDRPAGRADAPAAAATPGTRQFKRADRTPRPTPACASGTHRVGEEDQDCAVFGQCCKPDAAAH
ncbi:MAG: hypothetical protein ACKPBU_03695 [Alphaproteobacteria bacterium]